MYCIAVIEDEPILRRLMAERLQENGYAVETAEDGLSGWQLVQEKTPHLILLDLLMPLMSGYDFLIELRKHPDMAHIPCIVLSNSGQVNDLDRAYECGATDVLIKAEFNPDQLVEKVAAYLQKEATSAEIKVLK